jgi:sugar O-acyltransferase (sialic acid O-acetyltransferase NeuD family)
VADVVIVGTGGMGRETAAWLGDAGRGPDLVGFLDDAPDLAGTSVAGLTVLGGLDWLDGRADVEVVVALGSPAARTALLRRLDGIGAVLAGVQHPSATVGPRAAIGPGVIICPYVLLTCDVTVGRVAIINWGARVGHDVRIGEAAFIAPGVHLAGNVTVGDRAQIGIGAVARPGVVIGEDAVVGAGAAVVHDVEPGTTVVGVPARPLPRSR